jgi:2-oxoglutarate/2-oxoacid ferredoxin oxidoreductase subunit beta
MDVTELTRRDLASDQEVRWCPGCGDYAILKGVQSALATLGVKRENMAIVSGIGCAARFPYYMNTYGMHSIHGRSPAVATGLKMANPDMHVWVVGGDGDMMSIGGNHLIHAIRRNIDLTILLFNNRIYGLTKGQFSPTSGLDIITKSSPMGSIDPAFDPINLALGAGATFVGRTVDLWSKHLQSMIVAAHAHQGTSVIEILQNCIIFNDGVFDEAVGRKNKSENSVELVHGEPIIFGAESDKGLRLKGVEVEVVKVADVDASELLKHDVHAERPGLARLLGDMPFGEFPVATGIFRQVAHPSYERSMTAQVELAQAPHGGTNPSLQSLFEQGDTWTVE